jgi:uncharacterized protein DUF397
MTTECDLVWRRSSFSGDGGTGGGNCVEAAVAPGRLELRDSKNPGPTLALPRPALSALLRHVG